MTVDKMKDKIAKLLAKAEGTDNVEEAEAFTAAAERLMLKWGIAHAELESAGKVKPEEITEVSRTYKGDYNEVMVTFAHNICRGFGNLHTLQSIDSWRNQRTLYIVGHKSDVETVTQLLNSLELQSKAAMFSWWKTQDERTDPWISDWEKYKIRRSFFIGYGRRCGTRLRDLREEVEVDASPGAALVLVGKQEKVDNWVEDRYGPLRAGRQGVAADAYARTAGAIAAEKANLGQKSVDRTKEVTS